MLKQSIRYTLAVVGATLWVGLWYERYPLLGVSQGVLIGLSLWDELLAYLRRQ